MARKKSGYHAEEHKKYEMLCRKAIQLPAHVSSRLKCRYIHKNNPYLLIGPLKEEEAFHEPRIVLYRDVIYDSEMETVKKLAQPKVSVRHPYLGCRVADFVVEKRPGPEMRPCGRFFFVFV